MNNIINTVRNWFNPFGYPVYVEIDTFKFTPTEQISAYQLYTCLKMPVVYYNSSGGAKKYEKQVNDWYNTLSNDCKTYMVPTKVTLTEYHHY